MSDKQQTIKKIVRLKGKGLHTGNIIEMTFHPAPVNHGLKFKRLDIENTPVIEALVDFVTYTDRGTVLQNENCKICTTEHLLASVYALGIDNLLIEMDGEEVPICDGSAIEFVKILKIGGIEEQKAEKKYFQITEKIVYKNTQKGTEILGFPDDKLSITTLISFDSTILNNQYATLNRLEDFEKEIAKCRTFVYLRELEPLLKNNLIKGGDLENAIIILDKDITQEKLDELAQLFNHPPVAVKPKGVFNNIELRFDNEPARHKLLDVIGDLALIGRPIKGKIIATRPGHKSNTNFAKQIRKQIKKENDLTTMPNIDLASPPALNINEIKKLLPHRYPFLLVDKVYNITDTSIIAVKNTTINESFFAGHFPDEPVMPGVLLIEAMAQAGGIFVLHNLESPELYSTYFLKQDGIKFRKKVIPGDTIIFKLKQLAPLRRGIVNMKGVAFVGKDIVAEGTFIAQVIKNKK